mgnify:CR=1 FL=1
MEKTLGKKLCALRKFAELTQEAVAETLGVSPQAVSKWENDFSCPDIMMLPKIARLYGIRIDDLFSEEPVPTAQPAFVPPVKNADVPLEKLYLNVYVLSKAGDDIKVHIPFVLVRELVETGKNISGIFGTDLSGVDLESVYRLVQNGAVGEFVTVITQNGDTVRVVVEA